MIKCIYGGGINHAWFTGAGAGAEFGYRSVMLECVQ